MMEKTRSLTDASTVAPETRGAHGYEETDLFTIPEDVPELGVEAGDLGTIATVYDDGRMLDVEIGRDDGSTIGFVDVRIEDDGSSHVVGLSPIGSPRPEKVPRP